MERFLEHGKSSVARHASGQDDTSQLRKRKRPPRQVELAIGNLGHTDLCVQDQKYDSAVASLGAEPMYKDSADKEFSNDVKAKDRGLDSSEDATLCPGSTLDSVSRNPRSASKRRRRPAPIRQSKIELTPGISRFISTEPIDSEDETFRATQVESKQDRIVRLARASKAALEIDSDTELESVIGSVHGTAPAASTSTWKEKLVVVSDDSEDEEALVTPLRRRKRFMPPPPNSEGQESDSNSQVRSRKIDREEQDRSAEACDLDQQRIKIGEKRQRNSQKSTFRENLERLRRKKAGLPDSGDDEDEDAEDESEFEVLEAPPSPRDWIVEDDYERQQLIDDLPEEFQQPRQPLEQFKIAVQWEILDLLIPQNGLKPDAYFKPAIDWLRDRTYGKSQAAISSSWRRTFLRALQRGPHLNAIETGNLGYFCDACGRTNRVATYVVRFEGSRYDHVTLEDLDSDASSSDDDLDVDENAASDLEAERERKERLLRAEFNLGSNCYDRTVVTHELFHLRKHLREDIHDKLGELGHFSAQALFDRSIMMEGKRIEQANEITEQLEAARFQQRLWNRYKDTIEKHEGYIADPHAGRKRARH